MPLLIGGGGERVTLRLVAELADLSNTPGPPDVLRQKNRVIDDWCAKVGRNPAQIERLSVDLFLDTHVKLVKPPRQIILNLEATHDPLHGQQEGRFSTATTTPIAI